MLNRRGLLAMGAAAGASAMMPRLADAATPLRCTEFGPERGVRAQSLMWIADQIAETSGGDMNMNITWGGALVKARDVLDGVGSGFADLGYAVSSYTPRRLPLYEVTDLPFGNGGSDIWVGLRAAYDLATTNEHIQKEFADNDVVYISNFTTGPVLLVCKDPINSLSDLSGRKMRASGEAYLANFGKFGATIVSFPQVDVYQALENGLVDCNQVYYSNLFAYRQYEVAQHIVEMNFGQLLSYPMIMNGARYAALSQDQKNVLQTVGHDAIDEVARNMISSDAGVKEKLVAGVDGHQIEVTSLDETLVGELSSVSEDFVQSWIDERTKMGLPGAEVVEQYRALLEKYETERQSQGYPWERG
ncbi:C4-dicarboxylate TRAP transporter substrate-binding protein [Arenibacterium halophilum]|uniref:TRAP-type C4-dicarboxylate transport system substrate-binding protein n=1 Tax=Arenibacterium halophilum TaxID=2583821 RepID=A0ABY2X247_9RHOB|nr:C4-dicarboxylate TRAP transporter substrate-binding protein [Arenibacterium halophilum]TMV09346.1 hypothetical protein FGK64_19875 [Arenibacterium halophilum]